MSANTTASQGYIEFNVDFEQPAVLKSGDVPFSDTPMIGVKRMMFERRGDEIAKRATSCVRYAPESYFKSHSHPGGEEYLVLEGTFSDQNGDFSKGWYVRNPVGSSHKPFTHEGCEIFVKLSQLPEEESRTVEIDTNTLHWDEVTPLEHKLTLWQSTWETTSLHRYSKGFSGFLNSNEVIELFVVSGVITIDGEDFPDHSWLRFPANQSIKVEVKENAVVYRKLGTGVVR